MTPAEDWLNREREGEREGAIKIQLTIKKIIRQIISKFKLFKFLMAHSYVKEGLCII